MLLNAISDISKLKSLRCFRYQALRVTSVFTEVVMAWSLRISSQTMSSLISVNQVDMGGDLTRPGSI